MFKVSDAEDRRKILDQYKTLKQNAVKDGKPYIVTCEVGETGQDPRSKGWNIVAKTTFASKADMDYYDNECEAHKGLKVFAKPLVEDVTTVWFESIFSE
ncbi:hypothetical protein EPUS_07359 [Endocarpon pusillum Z07020]|uniref:Stress-response A/B barrel domain-containing protein n=1 Tax=Endocarpon pusillum (strain Z07020 / HMAS-L-300199) TaxID=1263415 RepID=U1FZX1_ENDPU|nr:uncharacterized protein EPUS_07359 [Endocarpon pusillum Z07020]ERF70502.1 hypothetical protein EPUS_07359 [Endocarpon pusillum Z07020]